MPEDAKNPAAWINDALFQPESRQPPSARLTTSACPRRARSASEPPGTYTFWDYQAGAWQRDQRHPHRLRTCCRRRPPTASVSVETHRDARDMEKPSDHVPVVVELELED